MSSHLDFIEELLSPELDSFSRYDHGGEPSLLIDGFLDGFLRCLSFRSEHQELPLEIMMDERVMRGFVNSLEIYILSRFIEQLVKSYRSMLTYDLLLSFYEVLLSIAMERGWPLDLFNRSILFAMNFSRLCLSSDQISGLQTDIRFGPYYN